MLISAGRQTLIVAVEMVDYDGISEDELARTGAADKADHRYQQCYRAPHHLLLNPVSPHKVKRD
jgi:hypothetical protein